MKDTPNKAPDNDGFGLPVRDSGTVPGGDLGAPAGDRTAEASNLERHLWISEVPHDLGDPLRAKVCVSVIVDLTHDLFGVPRYQHLLSGVTGAQQPHQAIVLVVGESFACHCQATSGSLARIMFAASMAKGPVLHAALALVQPCVGELHDMERIGDLHGVGEHRVEYAPIHAR